MKVGANLPHKVPLEEIYLFPETNFRHGSRIKVIFLLFKKKRGLDHCCADPLNCSVARQYMFAYCLIEAVQREQFHRDTLEHSPYSPHLAPPDFFLFPKMKDHLAGKPEGRRLNNQEATWYEEDVHKLVPLYKYLNVKGSLPLLYKPAIGSYLEQDLSSPQHHIPVPSNPF